MLPDRVSNPGPLTYESGALPIALLGPACFGFNDPVRQYFSLYRAVSKRGRKKREMIDERINFQITPTRTHCKDNRPLSYFHPN